MIGDDNFIPRTYTECIIFPQNMAIDFIIINKKNYNMHVERTRREKGLFHL